MKNSGNTYYVSAIKWLPAVIFGGIVAYAVPKYAHHYLFIIGTILVVLGVAKQTKNKNISKWQEHSGRIINITEKFEEVSLTPTVSMKYFYPEVEYEYLIDGESQISNRVGFDIESIWIPETNKWGDPTKQEDKYWYNWTIDTAIPVYVNPGDARESVLLREIRAERKSHHLAQMLAGAILLLLWTIYIINIE